MPSSSQPSMSSGAATNAGEARDAGQRRLTMLTVIRFLFGDRRAILDVAAGRGAVWVGLVLVLSAALAREYDGEDLLHEPWHLLLPLGASLATSFLLYVIVYGVSCIGASDGSAESEAKLPPFFATYRRFLGLYWMTAPLAWLYAIPVERLVDAPSSVVLNLDLLGAVSLWRVLLITRVISVLLGWRVIAVLVVVMLFADLVVLGILFATPLPVVSLMGGVRLNEAEQLTLSIGYSVGILGALSFPLWLLGTAFFVPRERKRGGAWRLPPQALAPPARVSRGLWAGAFAAVIAGLAVLPLTQPEQIRRGRVERFLEQGALAEAIAEMSRHEQSDFPPHWDPPPRIGYGQRRPDLTSVLQVIDRQGAAPWVRAIYEDKRQRSGRRL